MKKQLDVFDTVIVKHAKRHFGQTPLAKLLSIITGMPENAYTSLGLYEATVLAAKQVLDVDDFAYVLLTPDGFKYPMTVMDEKVISRDNLKERLESLMMLVPISRYEEAVLPPEINEFNIYNRPEVKEGVK